MISQKSQIDELAQDLMGVHDGVLIPFWITALAARAIAAGWKKL